MLDVPSRQFALLTAAGGNAPAVRAIGLDDAPVVKVPFGGQFPEQMADAGRSAVITQFPVMPADQAERTAFLDRRREFLTRLTAFKPALVVELRRDPGRSIDYFAGRQLVDPALKGRAASGPPVVALFGDAAAAAFDALPTGLTGASFSVRLSPPAETDAPQRNVIGLLPGSDPKLADTYVLVTAHYDGQGTRPGPDRVWNSANDNGSGTVSVIELAAALAATGSPRAAPWCSSPSTAKRAAWWAPGSTPSIRSSRSRRRSGASTSRWWGAPTTPRAISASGRA